MKTVHMILLTAAILVGTGGMVIAGESSVELGKKLFNDPTLGGSTNPKSCNTCHPDGKDLEKAASKSSLSSTINNCIKSALNGEKVDGRSVEMRSLKMYIESLAK
ncbi:MAG: cytochrome-c peroxidase [Proteobacteria bacterium]|nr:cytochrome-c peroxidase [Pseudomonadota bacterium]MBU1686718.1 cytochrome-c peroxidase [Pseudomonadota bacterium]